MSTADLEGEDSEAALVVSEAKWARDADLEAQIEEQKVLALDHNLSPICLSQAKKLLCHFEGGVHF